MPVSGERTAADTAGGEPPFAAGQRMFARVLQVLAEGRAVLDVGGEALIASTPIPVKPGDEIAVTVRSLVPIVELAVEAPTVQFSERAYAAETIRRALQAAAPRQPLTPAELETLTRALAHVIPGGPDGPSAHVLKLLRPLPLGRDGAPLADLLRTQLTSGGAAFEASAARALDPQRAGAAAEAALHADLRWLLAAVARYADAMPEVAALRERLVDDLGRRQLDTLLARVERDAVRVDVPVAFGHTATVAHLAVTDDGPRPAAAERPAGRAITLNVEHPDLGPVQACAQWHPGESSELQIRFAVRDAPAVEALQAATRELTARLQAAGFRRVGVAVVVDPDVRGDAPEPPHAPPAGGSIVSALA
jgi:hypothetical protein